MTTMPNGSIKDRMAAFQNSSNSNKSNATKPRSATPSFKPKSTVKKIGTISGSIEKSNDNKPSKKFGIKLTDQKDSPKDSIKKPVLKKVKPEDNSVSSSPKPVKTKPAIGKIKPKTLVGTNAKSATSPKPLKKKALKKETTTDVKSPTSTPPKKTFKPRKVSTGTSSPIKTTPSKFKASNSTGLQSKGLKNIPGPTKTATSEPGSSFASRKTLKSVSKPAISKSGPSSLPHVKKSGAVSSIKERTTAFQSASVASAAPSWANKKDPKPVNKLRASSSSAIGKTSTAPKTARPFSASTTSSTLKKNANSSTPSRKFGGDSFKPSNRGIFQSDNPTLAAPPPKKSLNLLDKKNAANDAPSHAEATVALLTDKSKAKLVEAYIDRIHEAGGFPITRRLSVRDNDLVATFTKIIANDPSIEKSIVIDGDPRFEHLPQSLIVQAAEALRFNFYITDISIRNVELGNGFLTALATSLESNFVIKTIDLSNNSFTNDGLMEFVEAMGSNSTVVSVNLSSQHSPVFADAQDRVIEALQQNTTIQSFDIDFKTSTTKGKSKDGKKRVKDWLSGNKGKKNSGADNIDDRLIQFLQNEADRAEELYEQRKAEEEVMVVKEDDWDYLYELSKRFDRYKLEEEPLDEDDEGEKSKGLDHKSSHQNKKSTTDALDDPEQEDASAMPMTADGAFLTEEFISKYISEHPETGSIIFDFRNQFKVFKRFPVTDPARRFIVEKFVSTLLGHPRMKDLTGINMANTCCGNDFLEFLAEKCLDKKSMLPNLYCVNFETNYITETGVVALSKCIGSETTFPYLQVVRLENQRHMLSSKAELKLAKAMCVNRGLIRLSLRVRNLLERQQIQKYIQRNVDFLRQARRQHAIATGTLQERKRNEMELFFDKIAANDPSVTQVEIIGNQRFLSLNSEEKIKAAYSFANNTHVKVVMMSTLQLDCKFAQALASSLEQNSTIERLLLDSNAIAGDGMKAIIGSLAKNSSITELQIRHQSKVTNSADEEVLPDLIEPNTSLAKLGIDIRGQLAKTRMDKKMANNREIQRKARVASAKK